VEVVDQRQGPGKGAFSCFSSTRMFYTRSSNSSPLTSSLSETEHSGSRACFAKSEGPARTSNLITKGLATRLITGCVGRSPSSTHVLHINQQIWVATMKRPYQLCMTFLFTLQPSLNASWMLATVRPPRDKNSESMDFSKRKRVKFGTRMLTPEMVCLPASIHIIRTSLQKCYIVYCIV
jgi:hypothetical protein